jgi:DNA-binding transcriptional MocR family regulator
MDRGAHGYAGGPCHEDNIVITSGSQQALEFLGRLLLSPGDTALVTAPTYLGALQAFSAGEPRYDELRPEQGNRTPQSYADGARETAGRVKLAYVVPSFANPTGETLSLAARERLLDLAAELDIPVIEDAGLRGPALRGQRAAADPRPGSSAARQHRWRARHLLRHVLQGPLARLARGWIVAPRPMIQRLVLIKQASDLNSSTSITMVMHRLAETAYGRKVESARAHYRRRRDAMLAALQRHMPEGVTWTRPGGGLFVWLRLPEGVDAASLLDRAVNEANVAFGPRAFFFDGRGRNTLRLSYSLPSEAEIEDGIARLAKLI